DLRLTGTGLEPKLDGTATANDLVLSLPFSRLHVRRGTAYFSPDGAVMNPRLDISAVSEVRDYRINVYIYGTAEDPKTTFSSQPPLPQEEIIALLATGAAFEELTGNANVVAGRAGWLLLQKLYRKVFGGGDPGERGENDFLERFDVNLGPVDPQTGAQSIVTRFKIDENWVLIATSGIGGGVQGKVKYLIRFR
nr:translocation/assembly module TamB domain-containing protein [Chthoniobacterales bacterium]